jgi:hypothetical protein
MIQKVVLPCFMVHPPREVGAKIIGANVARRKSSICIAAAMAETSAQPTQLKTVLFDRDLCRWQSGCSSPKTEVLVRPGFYNGGILNDFADGHPIWLIAAQN